MSFTWDATLTLRTIHGCCVIRRSRYIDCIELNPSTIINQHDRRRGVLIPREKETLDMQASCSGHRCPGWRSWVAALILFGALSVAGAQTSEGAAVQSDAAAADDQPFVLKAAPTVDEELFLVSVLEDTYASWPTPEHARESSEWIAQTRQAVRFLRSTIDAHRLHGDVAQLYDECLQLLQAYEQYSITVGAINAQAVEDAEQGVAEAGVKGALAGLWEALRSDSTSDDVNKAAKDKVIDSLSDKGVEILFARQKALSAEEQKLQAQIRATLSDAQAIAGRLTRELGWHFGEVDFSDLDNSHLNTWVAQRVRDPFALCKAARQGVEQEQTAGGLVNRASRCVQAALLVPDGDAYSGYRANFIWYATAMGLDGVALEQRNYTGRRSSMALPGLRLVRTYLTLEPTDPEGFGHMELARALAFTGRYPEALVAAEVALKYYKDDSAFLYRYAKLLILNGYVDASAEALRRSLQQGFSDITSLRSDPDFAGLRRARQEQFEALTTVRMHSQISWGMMLDDVVLHNDSDFPLTHLKINLQIAQGERSWNISQGDCTSIAAHGTCTISNAMSIPDDRYDRANLTYTCDQSLEQVAQAR